jgi:hypothetical protein
LWVGFVYLRLVISSFRNEVNLVTSVLFISSSLTLIGAIFIEGLSLDGSVWSAAIGGVLVWFPPHFLLLMRKYLVDSRGGLCYVIVPFIVAWVLVSLCGIHNEKTLSIGLAIVIGSIGTSGLSASISERIDVKQVISSDTILAIQHQELSK